MPNFAQIVIIGHIGKDPELSYTNSGMAVCKFSVAVKTGFGERTCTTWWRVTLFGKKAEAAAKNLQKGSAVVISGETQNREYEKDGEKRYSLEITADNWTFAGSAPAAGNPPPPNTASGGGFSAYDPNDDIPFAPIGRHE